MSLFNFHKTNTCAKLFLLLFSMRSLQNLMTFLAAMWRLTYKLSLPITRCHLNHISHQSLSLLSVFPSDVYINVNVRQPETVKRNGAWNSPERHTFSPSLKTQGPHNQVCLFITRNQLTAFPLRQTHQRHSRRGQSVKGTQRVFPDTGKRLPLEATSCGGKEATGDYNSQYAHRERGHARAAQTLERRAAAGLLGEKNGRPRAAARRGQGL